MLSSGCHYDDAIDNVLILYLVLEDIQVDLDGNEDVKTSGEEDTDSLCHKASQACCLFI